MSFPMIIKVWHSRIKNSLKSHDVVRFYVEVVGTRIKLRGHTTTNQDVDIDLDGNELMQALDTWRKNHNQ